MYFRNFNYIPFDKKVVLHLKTNWIPFTRECFVPSLVEIGLVVLENKILKLRLCIFAISLLSPLWKGRGPSFEEIESPLSKDALYQVWLKLTHWF